MIENGSDITFRVKYVYQQCMQDLEIDLTGYPLHGEKRLFSIRQEPIEGRSPAVRKGAVDEFEFYSRGEGGG